jgi:dolichol-phosphate mannosyltransferase
MKASLWLFLPTYNEAGNVERIVRAIAAQLERTAPSDWRLLVVDDASPDGTGELADGLAAELAQVEVLHRPAKEGLGKAYLAGFAHALAGGAERVVVMDADFSHDPEHLPALLAAGAEADLALGSRYVPGGRIADWPPIRRLLSRCGSLYARTILGVDVHDLTSGFRCVHRRVLETVEPSTLRAQGYVFNIELTYRAVLAGFRVTEVPICFRDRTEGDSKLTLRIAVEALRLVPKLRSLRRPVAEQRRGAPTLVGRGRIRWRSRRWPRRSRGILASEGTAAAGEDPGDGADPRQGPGDGSDGAPRQNPVGDASAP